MSSYLCSICIVYYNIIVYSILKCAIIRLHWNVLYHRLSSSLVQCRPTVHLQLLLNQSLPHRPLYMVAHCCFVHCCYHNSDMVELKSFVDWSNIFRLRHISFPIPWRLRRTAVHPDMDYLCSHAMWLNHKTNKKKTNAKKNKCSHL